MSKQGAVTPFVPNFVVEVLIADESGYEAWRGFDPYAYQTIEKAQLAAKAARKSYKRVRILETKEWSSK